MTNDSAGFDDIDVILAKRASWRSVGTWTRAALCWQLGELDWHPEGVAEQKALTKVCAVCPVRRQCLTFALETGEHSGVWGGLTERQLRRAAALTPTGTRHIRPNIRIPCPWCKSKAVRMIGPQRVQCLVCDYTWPGLVDLAVAS